MENNEKISVLLKVVGVSPANYGWRYIRDGVNIVLEDAEAINYITKRLYPNIARKYGVTAQSVERAIRYSIVDAFNIMPKDVAHNIFRNTIRENGKVTNSEFISTLAELIKSEPNNPIWKRTE
jgi:two-component system response regulator (stage 0 sporulation protein A)